MSKRMYFWSAAEGPSKLRHGRAHAVVYGVGTRGYPDGTGRRRDVQVNAEWWLLVPRKKSFGLGVRFKWGTNGSETTPDVAIHLSRLGDLWLGFAGLVPWRWLERHRPDGKVDYDSRVFELSLSRERFVWEFWARDGHWSRSDPWWMRQSHSWELLLLGRCDVARETVKSGTCVVPMPEANYPATFTVEKITRRYRRPLGRLRDRLLGARSFHRTDITPGRPVPVPGKGENSWDCGDDAIHALSVGGADVEEAIGALVASALTTRRRHGGEHMSVPVEVPS